MLNWYCHPVIKCKARLLEADTTEVLLRQQVVSVQARQEQLRMQGEDLHRVEREHGFCGEVEQSQRGNRNIEILCGINQGYAVVASSKNVRLINQLKSIQVECGALLKQLAEMREQLEKLAEQKSQFCK